MKRPWIVALALLTAVTSYAPAEAFPVANVSQAQSSDILHVRDSGRFRHKSWKGGNHHSGGRWNRGKHYGGYYGGYHHDNAGAIIGGLAAGAIIGGILSNGARSGGSHAQYCYSRYKSYRASDNTFQPYNGPRQQCR